MFNDKLQLSQALYLRWSTSLVHSRPGHHLERCILGARARGLSFASALSWGSCGCQWHVFCHRLWLLDLVVVFVVFVLVVARCLWVMYGYVLFVVLFLLLGEFSPMGRESGRFGFQKFKGIRKNQIGHFQKGVIFFQVS